MAHWLVISRSWGEGFILRWRQGPVVHVRLERNDEGDKVKVAIDAPPGVLILRDELLERREKETGT